MKPHEQGGDTEFAFLSQKLCRSESTKWDCEIVNDLLGEFTMSSNGFDLKKSMSVKTLHSTRNRVVTTPGKGSLEVR